MSLIWDPWIRIEANFEDDGTGCRTINICLKWDESCENDDRVKIALLASIREEINFHINHYNEEGNLFDESNVIRK